MPLCLKENGEKHFSDVEKVFVHSKQLAELAPLKCLEAVPVSAELAKLSEFYNTFVNFYPTSAILLITGNIHFWSFYFSITLADATCFVAHVRLLFPLSSPLKHRRTSPGNVKS